MSWLYNGKPVTDIDLDGKTDFVYLITHVPSGRMYVGKKRLETVRRTKVKNKKKRKVVRKQSDWQEYWGSNETLRLEVEANGQDQYRREIIRLCTSKSEASYYETKEIFVRDVLLKPSEYYNEWVSCKITRKHMSRYSK